VRCGRCDGSRPERFMPDIFLSYSRQDRSRVEGLVKVLSSKKWSIWWDTKLRTGEVFDRKIEDALAEVKCVVVAWSSNSVRSMWVRAEAHEAQRRGILVPVLLDEVVPPLPFGQIETRNLVGWDGREDAPEILRLIEDIDALIGGPKGIVEGESPSGQAAPATSVSQGAEKSIAYWMLGTILLAAGIIFLAIYLSNNSQSNRPDAPPGEGGQKVLAENPIINDQPPSGEGDIKSPVSAVRVLSNKVKNESIEVVLDVAHSDLDSGAERPEQAEAEYVLSLARLLKEELERLDINTGIVIGGSIPERAARTNEINPILAVSVHANYSPRANTSGCEAYVAPDDPKARRLAGILLEKISSVLGIPNRGVKESGFIFMKRVQAPAVSLETLFLSNDHDLQVGTKRKKELAQAIARGIQDFIQAETSD
jgi:N-acetylmuramoyl-L-alanine amidase